MMTVNMNSLVPFLLHSIVTGEGSSSARGVRSLMFQAPTVEAQIVMLLRELVRVLHSWAITTCVVSSHCFVSDPLPGHEVKS